MKYTLLVTILFFAAASAAFAQSKCFQNDALKGTQFVNLKISGNRVAGTFQYENGESELAKVYQFSGTLASDVLRVRFKNAELPNVAPSKLRDLNWRLLKTAESEILRIKFFGKNYETNKYADYFADFNPCEINYGLLEKKAKPVRFDKGKISAKIPISFENLNEQKVFSLNIRRGQTLFVDAASCKISIYLPDGKIYEFVEWESGDERTFASSTIDRMTIESLPQTGNYLVVLQKMAENARPDSIAFKITK
ncbi:MAG: hypothetical protein ACR2HG_01135 [Pyrinomonadaceae bacterium]